jgi:hypothetical protein
MRDLLLMVFALAAFGTSQAAPQAPSRTVLPHGVVSQQDPGIRIELPETAHFIGSVRWPLYDVADAEIYMFVEADDNKKVQRYYWIQFEAYLPSKPDYFYEYKKGTDESIAGLAFNLRARFGPSSETPKAGSDLEQAFKLIADAGYTLPADLMNVRFVHLTDASRRKELMVIYAEDMAPAGVTSAELIATGTIDPRWAAIETGLIERAKARITFIPQP